FKIEIPKNKLKDYEKLIIKKMENGFWNEYIGEEIVFIFKFNDGKIKRLVLNQDTEEEIDKLASEFMKDENWNKSCVWKWLAENGFYTDLIVHTDFGVLVNSGAFNGLKSSEAKEHIIKFLENKKFGKKTVNYKLRDWLVSRQRYWGTPIPIVYCDKCGIVAVKEKDLPVKLPEKVKFGKGNPLTTSKSFLEVKCSECKGKARRETDTMDTFFDSSWYFLRYPDSKNNKKPFDVKKENYWMPVDQYIGGAEHACMHLIYARFFTKALRDLGFFGKKKIDEPFTNLFNQGMLHKGGKVMAKSVGNVVVPEEVSKKYGIDTARLFLMSVASPDKDIEWSEKGIEGSLKFMKKVISYFDKVKIGKTDNKTESRLNKTIKEVTLDIEGFNYNLAIIKIRDLFNSLPEAVGKKTLEDSLKLLHPFCPHITEELWKKIGGKGFISLASWPKADEKKIDSKLEEQEEAVDKISEDINHVVKIVKDKGKKVDKVFIYVLPNEKKIYKNSVSYISKKTNLKATVFGVNDKDKYDPENKSKKVKPGRPGIYLE
ncbi:MAG: class I tRNA ligase family protein, partial [Candidatus Nanoarchaeia archaeon]